MLNRAEIYEKFLEKFTEEVLLELRYRILEKERLEKEEERIRRAIAVEKLKKKLALESTNEKEENREEPKQEEKNIIIANARHLNQPPRQLQVPIPIHPLRPPSQQMQQNRPVQPTQQNQPWAKSVYEETGNKLVVSKPDQESQIIEIGQSPKTQEQIIKTENKEIKTVQQVKNRVRPLPPQRPVLKPMLPPALKPIPPKTQVIIPGDINFGKLVFLVRDPTIDYIECQGENKNLIVRRGNNTFATETKLSKEEINALVAAFAEKTRIPMLDGLLKARTGNLEISANLSDQANSTFVIRKSLTPPPLPMQPQTTGRNIMMTRPIEDNSPLQKSIMHPLDEKSGFEFLTKNG